MNGFPTTYQDAFTFARRAIKRGNGLIIEINEGEATYWGCELEQFMDELAPGEPFFVKAVLSAPAGEDAEGYAWLITRDHLAAADQSGDAWCTGPREVSNRQLAMLAVGAPLMDGYERHVFRMYDGDGTLYYTGRAIFRTAKKPELDCALVAPLVDFGTPGAGAVTIRWQGHPEWECEN